MIYHQKNKLIIAVVIFVCFVALYFLTTFIFPSLLPSFGKIVGYPLWIIKTPFTEVGDYFISKKTLIEENKKLYRDIDSLELLLANYSVIENENNRLRNFLNSKTEAVLFSSAPVLVGPNLAGNDFLIVALPRGINFAVGDGVFVSPSVKIGVIESLNQKTATVRLFSSPAVITNVVLDRTGEPLEIRGLGSGSFSVEIPKDMDLEIDDVVTLSGTNLVIGFVKFVIENPEQTLKKALISSPVNVFSIREVFIAK